MLELGRPSHFDLEAYYKTINGLINADEIERALWLLDNPPGYFRDHPTEEMERLKKALHKKTWTPAQYRGLYPQSPELKDIYRNWPLRARLLEAYVAAHEEAVHLMELAPGDQWLYYGLQGKDLNFEYSYIGLDGLQICKPVERLHTIFVCFELIEHLSNPWEIYQNYLKFNQEADVIMLSTPRYTWMGGLDDWENRELGHLRTYTPLEFHDLAKKMFKGYNWTIHTDDTIVLIGRKT